MTGFSTWIIFEVSDFSYLPGPCLRQLRGHLLRRITYPNERIAWLWFNMHPFRLEIQDDSTFLDEWFAEVIEVIIMHNYK